jgi:protocatechuate 3,4-dioxygenase beta subunit
VQSFFESMVSRRTALIVGLGAIAAACTGRSPSASLGSPTASSNATPTAGSVATPSCIVTLAETEGPYFVDELLNRSDITTDPSTGTKRGGVPLTLTFQVSRVGSGGCTALSGAKVDVWHCDAAGLYSDVSAQSTVGQKFLRGYQLTDADGMAKFATIYPGWYEGRTVHIHFKVRTYSGTTKSFEISSQLFFDDAVTDSIYKSVPYSSRPNRDTRNQNDMVYTSNGNSGAKLLVTPTLTGTGYATTFAIGLNV